MLAILGILALVYIGFLVVCGIAGALMPIFVLVMVKREQRAKDKAKGQ